MIFKNKVKELEETITPIEVELADVLLATYLNKAYGGHSSTFYYVFKSTKDNKLYISDCNLHSSYNETLRINKFPVDQLFGNPVTNDVIHFGDKGKLYIKKVEGKDEFTSGSWDLYEPSNTSVDGEYIACEHHEKKDLKKGLTTKGTVYRFNDKLSFEELDTVELVNGYAKF